MTELWTDKVHRLKNEEIDRLRGVIALLDERNAYYEGETHRLEQVEKALRAENERLRRCLDMASGSELIEDMRKVVELLQEAKREPEPY